MWLWRLGTARRYTLDAYLEWMEVLSQRHGLDPRCWWFRVLLSPCFLIALSYL